MSHPDLATLVRAWVAGYKAQAGTPLLDQFRVHTRKATEGYPEIWFALCRRDTQAIDELSDWVFTRCDQHQLRRAPFLERTPFVTYAEEEFGARVIRSYTFYARLSLLRETLRTGYEHNLLRCPDALADAERFREVRGAVGALCVPVSDQGLGPRRWRLKELRPGILRTDDELVAMLRRMQGRPLEDRVRALMRSLGETTVEQLHALILQADPLPQRGRDEGIDPESIAQVESLDTLSRAALREALYRAWSTLEPQQRHLMFQVAQAAPYDEIVASSGGLFRSRTEITRALSACNEVMLRCIQEVFGGQPQPPKPQELAELLVDILRLMGISDEEET